MCDSHFPPKILQVMVMLIPISEDRRNVLNCLYATTSNNISIPHSYRGIFLSPGHSNLPPMTTVF